MQNRPVFVSTNHCQSFTVFLLDVQCSKQPRRFVFSFSCFSQLIAHLRNLFLLSTSVVQMLLTLKDVKSCEKQTKRCKISFFYMAVGLKIICCVNVFQSFLSPLKTFRCCRTLASSFIFRCQKSFLCQSIRFIVIHKCPITNSWVQAFHQPQSNVFSLSPFR